MVYVNISRIKQKVPELFECHKFYYSTTEINITYVFNLNSAPFFMHGTYVYWSLNKPLSQVQPQSKLVQRTSICNM